MSRALGSARATNLNAFLFYCDDERLARVVRWTLPADYQLGKTADADIDIAKVAGIKK